MIKTEKDKMLSGENYFPADKVLVDERSKAKDLCFELNSLPSSKISERRIILSKLFGSCSDSICVESNFFCDYGYNIFVGKNFYVNHNCVILDCAKVIFGDNVFIGPNCGFYTANHPIDFKERAKGIESAREIVVGNDVWIGGNVTVLAGVKIGDNVVIGAGSVVTKDIPANCIAYGNPCKVVKTI